MLQFPGLGGQSGWQETGRVLRSRYHLSRQWFYGLRLRPEQLTREWLKCMIPHTNGAGLTCQPSSIWETSRDQGGRWKCHLPAQGFVSLQCYRTSFAVDLVTSSGVKHSKLGGFLWAWR